MAVGTPPVSALIARQLGIEKGSENPREAKVGNLTMDQAKKIVEMKGDDLSGKDLKARMKEILGTCISMGITIDGKEPREIQRLIGQGKYDHILTSTG